MNPKNPDWYKILKLFKTVEEPYRINTGLTIPFIIGAYQLRDKPFENINSLIDYIIDIVIDKYPIIQRCHVINKHVVMVQEKQVCNRGYHTKYPKIKSKTSKNILFISTISNIGKTCGEICHSLNFEYKETIKRNEFSWSKEDKQWRKFHNREIELIKSI